MEWIVAIVFTFSLLYLFLFSLGQLQLTYLYRKRRREHQAPPQASDFLPDVTIQLPVFNEKYVVERLIDAVAAIDYPREKLEIQILDDSTDETSGIIYQKLEWLEQFGIRMNHIRRGNREGYKAGALAAALPSAKGEFIAIFDSDFVPKRDFLRKTLPYFLDARVGAVQTRWGYVNRDYSIITRLQAFGLDAHFSIEQTARNVAGSFINFNGTSGVWRKACIVDAGGWSADTLTEDLDLSYRAQLRGWKFTYLENVVTPGELPVLMPAVKLQQYRWNKGGAETARKIAPKILQSQLTPQQKMHAILHLFNSSVFVAILVASVMSLALLFVPKDVPGMNVLLKLNAVFFVGFLSVAFFYWTATRRLYPDATYRFALFPLFIAVSMGLSLHNGLAVIEGWLGIKTPFLRTPKFNIVDKRDTWRDNSYLRTTPGVVTVLEGLLSACFLLAVVKGIQMNDAALLVFHCMLAVGFGVVFFLSVKPWANA